MIVKIFEGREGHIQQKGDDCLPLSCNNDSLAGAVSQRACVYSGARVVLNPHHRCPAPGARAHRLRQLHLGHSGQLPPPALISTEIASPQT